MLRKSDVGPFHVSASRSTADSEPGDFVVTHSVTSEGIPIHTHSDYAVSYIFRGPCRCALDAHKSMEFVSGEIGLLNPGQAHEDFASAHPRDYLTVFLSRRFVLNLLSESGYSPSAAPDFPTAKLSAEPKLARIGDQLRSEVSEEQFGRDTVLDGLVAEMVILLFRCFHLANAEPDGGQSSAALRPEVRRALEFLQDNYTRRFSLDLLASAVGVSKFHLDRMFKKGVGIQPRAYVHSLRVEAAKRQLTGSAKPLIEIALELGFADQSHFSNVFKQVTGVSPQMFRTNR